MAESKKPVLEAHREASNVLSSHLRESNARARKKSPLPPPSEQEIKAEVRKILEQFLKKQLLNNNEEESAIPTGFQRVVVEDVIETDGPGSTSTSREGSRYSSKTSCAKCRSEASQSIPTSSIRSLTDDTINFPFIDEDENDVEHSDKDHSERSKSLPSNILSSVKIKDKDSLALSKSLSPTKLREIIDNGPPLKKVSEKGDKELRVYSGDDFLLTGSGKKDIEEIGIARGRQRLKSGTESGTDDSDYEEEVISPNRKKKSIFTRLKERMNRSLSRGRIKENEENKRTRSRSEGSVIIKRRKPRKKKDIGSSVDKRNDVVQNVHTHKHGHVEQHHYTNGNKSGMLMESEVWESTDVTGESEHKHEERHSNIRESKEQPSDTENGFMRRLKKMTSFKKSKKDKYASPSSKASKTDEIDFDHKRPKSPKTDYNRSMSSGQGYQERVHQNGDHSRQTTTTTIITGAQIQGCTDETLPEGPIKGEVMDLARKNKSFVLDFETCERQQRRLLPDGSLDTTVQQHVKVKHFDEGHDIEVDGTEDQAMCPRHAASGQPNPEKDRLYTAVAEKLAYIGDHYMATSPLSESTSSSVDHTGTRRVSARTPSLPRVDERDSEGLTELERQLRDTFRDVGDKFSLDISPDTVKDAAMEIAKQATYQTFQEVVDNKIGPGNSWDQIAAVFYLTKKAITLAGVGGAVAMQVKDLAAEYVADKFASWIVDQGGWDTCLDSDTDLDID